jgi:hypothetical protein
LWRGIAANRRNVGRAGRICGKRGAAYDLDPPLPYRLKPAVAEPLEGPAKVGSIA